MLKVAELATDNEWLINRVLNDMMGCLQKRQQSDTPAEIMTGLFKNATKTLGTADPYSQRKKHWQEELLATEETFRKEIESAKKPLKHAVKLACLANCLDDDLLANAEILDLFKKTQKMELNTEFWDGFLNDLKQAETILFIHDAAGEIVFDKLLMQRFPGKRWISVLKRQPIMNQATIEDAHYAGLESVVSTLVTSGEDVLGVQLNQASKAFKKWLDAADLIIAKGQACYETLTLDNQVMYFLFMVKCTVMADHLGLQVGDLVLESRGEPSATGH